MRVRSLIPLVALALTTACGTTVPLTSQQNLPAGALDVEVSPDQLVPSASASAEPGPPAPSSALLAGEASAPRSTRSAASRATRGPLRIGVTYAESGDAASALGASSDVVNGKATMESLVRALNAAGGLHGRRLEVVPFGWNTASSSYSLDAARACELFATDSRVEVVLDPAFGTIGGFGDCLQRHGVMHLTSATEGDQGSSSRRPLHANTQLMTDDRAYGGLVDHLVATSYLSQERQLGIVLEQCPNDEAAYRRTVLPRITAHRLRTPVVRTIQCTTGMGSAGAAAAAISGAVLAFAQARVDRVMFLSDYETVALLLFANAASSQGFRPGYALTSKAMAEATRPSLPPDQWPLLHGVGSTPGTDVGGGSLPATPAEHRCLRLARAGGLTLRTPSDRTLVYLDCSLFLLLEKALERSGGVSSARALNTAVLGLGTAFQAPGVVAGETRYAGDRRDGPRAVRVFGYVTGCECLRYRGPVLRLS